MRSVLWGRRLRIDRLAWSFLEMGCPKTFDRCVFKRDIHPISCISASKIQLFRSKALCRLHHPGSPIRTTHYSSHVKPLVIFINIQSNEIGKVYFAQVLKESVYDAFYRLTNPKTQITAYVFDVVRAIVPKSNLDDVFTTKEEVRSTSFFTCISTLHCFIVSH